MDPVGDGVAFMGKEEGGLLRGFALSRSFVISWPFVCNVWMPIQYRLFALMNDQNCF